ncbi:unnamed protein product [Urochloa decumbens]|uniref:Uncharacterized protein n=1 Tax=Urochloa decumbens TaxID=240449 RepID=A0ABC8VFI2_9POAL
MAPDRALTIRGASTMRRIDKLFNYISPDTHQIRVDAYTPLLEAWEIDAHMQAGVRGPDAFKVYNPELVRLKVEAARAVFRALARMDSSKVRVCVKIDRTRRKIAEMEERILALEEEIAAGGAQGDPMEVDAGAVEHEQVVYKTWVEKPEIATGPERQTPEEVYRQIRESKSASQLEYWKLNLKALRAKEEAQLQYLYGLGAASTDFESALFDERTRVGLGPSDYTFSY